ncbi:MAG: SDR family NAD(P)-dependent oxidoreductase [Gammaproteobacteria bacterium]|nr:SDR family NAD(P)-dependent oxidoreductase [Gammaproteobacteria bacterium]
MADNKVEGQSAIIFGVGPGLGLALARRFARAGMAVGLASRNAARLESWAGELNRDGCRVFAYLCDAGIESGVQAAFRAAKNDLGVPDLVVYNAGAFVPAAVLDITAREFEECWRVGCLGGFLVGREAARLMKDRGRGTILFTGATASLRGGAGFANLAVGKFGLRALAQSMARELGPLGIHVAHVIIDGQILSERYAGIARQRPADGLLQPDAIAENYLNLHRQHRSTWTQELDLRPWVEKF